MSRLRGIFAAVALVALPLVGCDLGVRLSGTPPTYAASSAKPRASAGAVASASADPLGPRPTLAAPKSFEPKQPVVYQGPNGLTIWYVERPELPVIAAALVVPYGSASDPDGKPGTMALLADMLDEGAGKRTALELSETVATMGASLNVSAGVDSSTVSMLSLKNRFDVTFELLCDVAARPRLEEKDFARVKKLWKNQLKKRSDDPMSVASTVAASVLYGKAPYAHPALGLLSKADAIELAGLKDAYKKTWRADRATLVVVGQISRKELDAALEKNLGGWAGKGDPLPTPAPSQVASERPKLVLVDRPKAVQTAIIVAGQGVTANSEAAPNLSLVNDALGGSFTSRLNQNLREKKGWTYGVGSGFTTTRSEGAFMIRTSVEVGHTGDSLKEIVAELKSLHAEGLTDDEVTKVKAGDRRDLVETYEGVTGTNSRLAQLVGAGLPHGFDAAATRLRQAATKDDLLAHAKRHFDPATMTIVLVGDKAVISAQLSEAGFDAPKLVGPEGQPLEK